MTASVKGKKEPPQPPPGGSNVGTVGNLLRPKTPKIDGEDSDSMASTSAATGICMPFVDARFISYKDYNAERVNV